MGAAAGAMEVAPAVEGAGESGAGCSAGTLERGRKKMCGRSPALMAAPAMAQVTIGARAMGGQGSSWRMQHSRSITRCVKCLVARISRDAVIGEGQGMMVMVLTNGGMRGHAGFCGRWLT